MRYYPDLADDVRKMFWDYEEFKEKREKLYQVRSEVGAKREAISKVIEANEHIDNIAKNEKINEILAKAAAEIEALED